jgi:hypothetical protein
MVAQDGNGGDPAEVYRRHHLSTEARQRDAAEAEQTATRLRIEGERLLGLAADWERRQLDCEAAAFTAGAVEGGLKKSTMSAKQISSFIRSHPGGPQAGAEAFKALPR